MIVLLKQSGVDVVATATVVREDKEVINKLKRGLERLSRQALSDIKQESLRIDVATRLLEIRRLLNGEHGK
jgi:hypothetical protein